MKRKRKDNDIEELVFEDIKVKETSDEPNQTFITITIIIAGMIISAAILFTAK